MASNTAATFLRSTVKRSCAAFTTRPELDVRGRQLLRVTRCQNEASIGALQHRIARSHFTPSSIARSTDGSKNKAGRQAEKNQRSDNIIAAAVKQARPSQRAPKNSLRKIAFEAQRSRFGRSHIRGNGKTRHLDPDIGTKDVTAYCAAETYDLLAARRELEGEGYEPDPSGTGLADEVLHVRTLEYSIENKEFDDVRREDKGDVFVFPSGCVVFWNVPQHVAYSFVDRLLPPAAGGLRAPEWKESEDLAYIEDPSQDSSQIVGDTIILGTKAHDQQIDTDTADDLFARGANDDRNSEMDTVLAKIAFSSALARSTKLAVLEERLNAYFTNTKDIPNTLAQGRKLRVNRSQILRRTGELLQIRAQLNLYSELTDSLPDLFWDSPYELGLEGYYEKVGKALDVNVRIKILNEKMDHASEIAAVLRERLSEKHSTMLEWMIIGLICIEVGFGIVHLWRESDALGENSDEKRTRDLLKLWLERELQRTA